MNNAQKKEIFIAYFKVQEDGLLGPITFKKEEKKITEKS